MVILTNSQHNPTLQVELDEDARTIACIDAFIRFLQFETYSTSSIYNALLNAADELAETASNTHMLIKESPYSIQYKETLHE